MTMTIPEILNGIKTKRALVVGDICLDRWCTYDPDTAEPSAETPSAVSADDVVSALVNLGYRKSEADRAVETIARLGAPSDFGSYLKEALKRLTGG